MQSKGEQVMLKYTNCPKCDSRSVIEHDWEDRRYFGCEACHYIEDVGERSMTPDIAKWMGDLMAAVAREHEMDDMPTHTFAEHSGGYRDVPTIAVIEPIVTHRDKEKFPITHQPQVFVEQIFTVLSFVIAFVIIFAMLFVSVTQ
jgi:ribosomal protein S27AE